MGKTSTGGQCLVKNLNFASLIVKIGKKKSKKGQGGRNPGGLSRKEERPNHVALRPRETEP